MIHDLNIFTVGITGEGALLAMGDYYNTTHLTVHSPISLSLQSITLFRQGQYVKKSNGWIYFISES